MGKNLDFDGLASRLVSDARNLLFDWFKGGKIMGKEFICGNLRGDPGRSLSINLNTGAWSDFSSDDLRGGDLISLYAAMENISQGEAFKRLSDVTGYVPRQSDSYHPGEAAPEQEPAPREVMEPPDGVDAPTFDHPTHGEPSRIWTYKNSQNSTLFYIARYDVEGGKQIVPWSWSVEGGWIMKGWPAPRPLYGLDRLAANPGKRVMIVEGEKAADAAREIVGDRYVVVTWPNGSKAFHKADWEPLFGRAILIWPDNDEPGWKAALEIATLLRPHCPEVKIIDYLKPQEGEGEEIPRSGWDAADAVEDGYEWDSFYLWAKTRLDVFEFDAAPQETEEVEGHVTLHQDNDDVTLPQQVILNKFNFFEPDADTIDKTCYAIWDDCGVVRTSQGQPVCNLDNVVRIIDGLKKLEGLIWYDEFHAKHFTNWKSEKPREWSDLDDIKMCHFMQRELGFQRMSDEIVNKAVRVYADRFIRNEPRDWMESLVWDGSPRIEDFFMDCFGLTPSDYARAASKNWWIGMVARIFRPGCKVDSMIILEGPQGKFKSTALSVIGGSWYTEAQESPLSKDFYMALHGKMIVEIAELDSFRRAEDTLIKRLLTCKEDRFRPPYGRASRDYPRQCVFVGTTNEDSYLRDHTGARRFWPIKIGQIDIAQIRDCREQLFAEAVKCFKAGEKWYEMPGQQTEEQQEGRRQADEWEAIILDYLRLKEQVTIREVALEGLKIDISKLDMLVQRRVGKILHVLRWTKHNVREGEAQIKIWRKPGYYVELPPF